MNIEYVKGDATAPVCEGAKIIAHVCKDIGRWGKGFVLAISRRWPELEREFKAAYTNGKRLALGDVQFVAVNPHITVANTLGQHKIATRLSGNEAPPVRYPAIEQCLSNAWATLTKHALEQHASEHMPRIACGLASGKWYQGFHL